MIYNFLFLNELRKLDEAGRIIIAKEMPHPSRTMKIHDLVYVIKGCYYITQEDVKIKAEEGDIFFLTAEKHHFSTENSPKNTECIFFHFPPHACDYCSNQYPSIPNKDYAVIPFKHSVGKYQRIKELFKNILTLYNKEDLLSEKMASTLLIQLFLEIENSLYKSLNNYGDELVENILKFLSDNESRNVTVDELSKLFSFSTKTLNQRFTKAMGISIHQYQLKIKLNSAAILLREHPRTTLKEIAQLYGFADEFHFSRAYKKKFGMSPKL
jgi:AraC-like DNA-binding protein